MADALVWHLIRDNNCFLKKVGRTARDGEVQFSAEPGNLLNVHTFKYSGLANSKTIGLSAGKSAKGKAAVALATKKGTAATSAPLKVQRKGALKTLNALTATHRADLTSVAQARFARLHQATYARGSKSASKRTVKGKGKVAKFAFSQKAIVKTR
jgi:large subunit ribosomal protein L28e